MISEKEVSTDNVFNCKETSGLQRKDIFDDYLARSREGKRR